MPTAMMTYCVVAPNFAPRSAAPGAWSPGMSCWRTGLINRMNSREFRRHPADTGERREKSPVRQVAVSTADL